MRCFQGPHRFLISCFPEFSLISWNSRVSQFSRFYRCFTGGGARSHRVYARFARSAGLKAGIRKRFQDVDFTDSFRQKTAKGPRNARSFLKSWPGWTGAAMPQPLCTLPYTPSPAAYAPWTTLEMAVDGAAPSEHPATLMCTLSAPSGKTRPFLGDMTQHRFPGDIIDR